MFGRVSVSFCCVTTPPNTHMYTTYWLKMTNIYIHSFVGRGRTGVGNSEVQTTMYKINKLQGYIVQHRKYIQYFIITLTGV